MIKKIIYIILLLASCSKEHLDYNKYNDIIIDKGMKVSILGDSYSTFKDYLKPTDNLTYYPNEETGVIDVTQTWWDIFITRNSLTLEYNNSYSGSTITKYEENVNSSYIDRYTELGDPDIIFIFGATNDSWKKIPIGDFIYENWDKNDLKTFRPAFAYLLHNIKINYPNAQIINIINTDLDKKYKSSMESLCMYYKVCCISLGEFDKINGHPSKKGMEMISNQISKVLIK